MLKFANSRISKVAILLLLMPSFMLGCRDHQTETRDTRDMGAIVMDYTGASQKTKDKVQSLMDQQGGVYSTTWKENALHCFVKSDADGAQLTMPLTQTIPVDLRPLSASYQDSATIRGLERSTKHDTK